MQVDDSLEVRTEKSGSCIDLLADTRGAHVFVTNASGAFVEIGGDPGPHIGIYPGKKRAFPVLAISATKTSATVQFWPEDQEQPEFLEVAELIEAMRWIKALRKSLAPVTQEDAEQAAQDATNPEQ